MKCSKHAWFTEIWTSIVLSCFLSLYQCSEGTLSALGLIPQSSVSVVAQGPPELSLLSPSPSLVSPPPPSPPHPSTPFSTWRFHPSLPPPLDFASSLTCLLFWTLGQQSHLNGRREQANSGNCLCWTINTLYRIMLLFILNNNIAVLDLLVAACAFCFFLFCWCKWGLCCMYSCLHMYNNSKHKCHNT